MTQATANGEFIRNNTGASLCDGYTAFRRRAVDRPGIKSTISKIFHHDDALRIFIK